MSRRRLLITLSLCSAAARSIEVPHEKIHPEHEHWISSPQSIALAIGMALSFALSSAEVGLIAYEFNRHGNGRGINLDRRWGGQAMLKNLVGLALFLALCSMLLALGSYWAHPFLALVILFILW